ncbi:MAG: TRAP transporter small permease [Deltaproteobacteria bacterium]|nr:TRAP transporter small permease [Deltaproteobacteria bacterium]
MTPRARIHAIVRKVQVAQIRLAMLALLGMIGITFLDVLFRFAFQAPIRGTYDLVEISLLIFVFFGMGAVFLKHHHIVVDLFDHVLSARIVAGLILLANLLSTACLTLMAWAMIPPALQSHAYGDVKLELGLPIYQLWIVALIGMVGTIICAVGAFFPAEGKNGDQETQA